MPRIARFALLTLVAVVVVFAGSASASPGAYRVLVIYVDGGGQPVDDYRAALLAEPGVTAVDMLNTESAGVPEQATLNSYDLVDVSDYSSFPDDTYSATLGDRLADFADQGGVVVTHSYTDYSDGDSYSINGRWVSGGYKPLNDSTNSNAPDRTLGAFDAASPLMQGVTTLTSDWNTSGTPTSGATVVARWADDNTPLVAYKGRVVAVAAETVGARGSEWSGDFAKLAINAVRWLGKQNVSVSKAGNGVGTVSAPGGLACGAVCAALFPGQGTVTLTATPATGSAFLGWTGDCVGVGLTCAMKVDKTKAVTATFVKPAVAFKASKLKLRKGKGKLKIRCLAQAPATCKLNLKAKLGRKVVGTLKGTVRGGTTKSLVLKLNRAGKSFAGTKLNTKLSGTVKTAGVTAKLPAKKLKIYKN